MPDGDDDDQKPPTRDPTGRFLPGNRTGAAGRPRGSRHKYVLAAEALLDGEAEVLTRKAIDKAKEGDATAMRFCLERIIAPRKDRPLRIELPKLTSAADATAALATITAAVATGEITPGEGADLNGIVAGFVKALETSDIEARLAALERKASDGK